MIASTQTNHPLGAAVHAPSAPLEAACSRLKAAGLRITQPRIAILTAMIQRRQPASIEQIHGDLASGSCDLVTVYRCLSAFEEIALVRRSFFHNGTSLYELNLTDAHRYHVVSKGTREVAALDDESTAELRATVQRIEDRLRRQGYTSISHVVEFFAEPAIAPERGQAPVNIR